MKKFTLLFVIIFETITGSYAQCWSSISAGDTYSLAIKTDGTLWVWGSNNLG